MDSETAEDIKRHFDVVADGLRTGFAELRSEVGGLRAEIQDVKRHSDVIAEALRTELRAEIQDVKRHSDVIAEALRTELRAEIQDVKRHSDVIAEALRSDIRTVAEGFVATNERLDRLEVRISEGFEELKSTIRISYVDLDRRVVVLEKRPPS
jgi:cell division protein FtsB